MDPYYFYIALLTILGILFPIYSIVEGPKVKVYLSQYPSKLILIYKQTMAIQIGLVICMCVCLYLNGDTVDVMGLFFVRNPFAITGLFTLGLLFLWIMNRKPLSAKRIESLQSSYSEVLYIIPQKSEEYRWGIILSFVVGICEEVLYRGFLYWQLSTYMPIWLAVICTNIIFGILHFGTGTKNAISTFFLGMIYSAVSVPFGTLWFAILAHIVTDIYSLTQGFQVKRSAGNLY